MSLMFRGLDKTETQRGFTPIEIENPCFRDECDLYYDGCKHCCYKLAWCADEQRQDGKNVIFKRIENDIVVVDKDEAPDGYEAIGSYSHVSCDGCDFNINNKPVCMDIDTWSKVDCIADWRKDRCNVIFKKKVNNANTI